MQISMFYLRNRLPISSLLITSTITLHTSNSILHSTIKTPLQRFPTLNGELKPQSKRCPYDIYFMFVTKRKKINFDKARLTHNTAQIKSCSSHCPKPKALSCRRIHYRDSPTKMLIKTLCWAADVVRGYQIFNNDGIGVHKEKIITHFLATL